MRHAAYYYYGFINGPFIFFQRSFECFQWTVMFFAGQLALVVGVMQMTNAAQVAVLKLTRTHVKAVI